MEGSMPLPSTVHRVGKLRASLMNSQLQTIGLRRPKILSLFLQCDHNHPASTMVLARLSPMVRTHLGPRHGPSATRTTPSPPWSKRNFGSTMVPARLGSSHGPYTTWTRPWSNQQLGFDHGSSATWSWPGSKRESVTTMAQARPWPQPCSNRVFAPTMAQRNLATAVVRGPWSGPNRCPRQHQVVLGPWLGPSRVWTPIEANLCFDDARGHVVCWTWSSPSRAWTMAGLKSCLGDDRS